jgi:hypothetical protein
MNTENVQDIWCGSCPHYIQDPGVSEALGMNAGECRRYPPSVHFVPLKPENEAQRVLTMAQDKSPKKDSNKMIAFPNVVAAACWCGEHPDIIAVGQARSIMTMQLEMARLAALDRTANDPGVQGGHGAAPLGAGRPEANQPPQMGGELAAHVIGHTATQDELHPELQRVIARASGMAGPRAVPTVRWSRLLRFFGL